MKSNYLTSFLVTTSSSSPSATSVPSNSSSLALSLSTPSNSTRSSYSVIKVSTLPAGVCRSIQLQLQRTITVFLAFLIVRLNLVAYLRSSQLLYVLKRERKAAILCHNIVSMIVYVHVGNGAIFRKRLEAFRKLLIYWWRGYKRNSSGCRIAQRNFKVVKDVGFISFASDMELQCTSNH